MALFMISCEKASELSSKALDEKLSRREAFELWLHAILCSLCRELKKQLQTLHLGTKRILDDPDPTCRLSPDAKKRISQNLKKEK